MLTINSKNLCESCFAEIGSEPCPYCGFSKTTYSLQLGILPIGSILMGKYIIGSLIGQGGFGITYRAYDIKRGETIAIKEYYPNSLVARATDRLTVVLSSRDGAEAFKNGIEKFYEEAKMVSKFNGNSNIVSVYEFFYENSTAYFTMEFLRGVSLKSYVEHNGPLSPEEALYVLSEMCDALMIAHSANVLHRDISPDNIMLSEGGGIKLIDFGAARQVMADTNKSMSIILKQGFAPLEQYQKHGNQGPWTDIYSLGASVYYAMTMECMEDPMTRMDDDEKFFSNRFGIEPQVWNIITRAVQIRIPDRYKTAMELKNDLNTIAYKPVPIVVRMAPVVQMVPQPAAPRAEPKPQFAAVGAAAVPPQASPYTSVQAPPPAPIPNSAYVPPQAPPYTQVQAPPPAPVRTQVQAPPPAPIPNSAYVPPQAPVPNSGQVPPQAPIPPTAYAGGEVQKPKKNGGKIAAIVCGIALAAGGIAAGIIFLGQNTGDDIPVADTTTAKVTTTTTARANPANNTTTTKAATTTTTTTTTTAAPEPEEIVEAGEEDFEYNIIGNEVMVTGYKGSETNVTVPNRIEGKKVVSIGENAFRHRTSITKVKIAFGVTSIGSRAFGSCSSLTDVSLPSSINDLGELAFDGCKSVNVKYKNKSYDYDHIYDLYDAVAGKTEESTTPETTAPPETTTTTTTTTTTAAPVTNPPVTEPPETKPKETKPKETDPPETKPKETKPKETDPPAPASRETPAKSFRYEEKNGKIVITGFKGSEKEVVVPEKIDGKKVGTIDNDAFANCSSIVSIELPSSVNYIGTGAFSGCSRLTSINIPSGVTAIRYNAFKGCSALSGITLPGTVTSLGNYAFADCSSLTSIKLPSAVDSIGAGAFENCTSLTSIDIPNGVPFLDFNTFNNCTSLTSVTIPNSVTAIYNGLTFGGCTSLTDIVLPDTLTKLSDRTFENCRNIRVRYKNVVYDYYHLDDLLKAVRNIS